MTENDKPQSYYAQAKAPSGVRSPHVLLVEDDDMMRDMLAEALRREGWRVTEFAEAFDWLQVCMRGATSTDAAKWGTSTEYDVVVSDIRMPGISGLDVLKIVRETSCAAACPPTIFITAFGDDETHKLARELGAAAVLDKPFAVKDLIAAVRAVVTAPPGRLSAPEDNRAMRRR